VRTIFFGSHLLRTIFFGSHLLCTPSAHTFCSQPRLDEAERAYRSVEARLDESKRRLQERDARATRQAAEHKRLLEMARAELTTEAEMLRDAKMAMVDSQTAAVERMQKQDAFRERTARRILLQLYRFVMVKCFRSWREETARAAGRTFTKTGAAGLAALRKSVAKEAEGSKGALGGGMMSSYM